MTQVVGKIIMIGEIEIISEKFSKREFVVETDEMYPQKLKLQFTGDKINILDEYKLEDEVEVGINLQGRDWTNKDGKVVYFITLSAWNIKMRSNKAQAENLKGGIEKNFQEDAIQNDIDILEDDDLPF